MLARPSTHTTWWNGEPPVETDGTPLRAVNVQRHLTAPRLPGMPPLLTLCCKPRDREFRDHREFLETYLAVLAAPVAEVAPSLSVCAHRRLGPIADASGPFAYRDTASARAGLADANACMKGASVGIVGLGGTGSYVLDLVAKCGVHAIHLFDDDVFEQHSAFRAPGAATLDDLRARRRKVHHFAEVYKGIHRGVVPHARRIDARTVPLLDMLDFAFLCIDEAAAKPAIIERLTARRIPFVDVGMGLRGSAAGIAGALRTTLVTPQDGSMIDRIPVVGDADGVYATNVQVCELNAMNAALAVLAWKRHLGFYAADRRRSNEVFVVESGRLHAEAGAPAHVHGDRPNGGGA